MMAAADGDAILQQADKALYTIKREGKSNFYFHNQKPPSELQAQTHFWNSCGTRPTPNHLYPIYQPILDTETNLISGLQIFCAGEIPITN